MPLFSLWFSVWYYPWGPITFDSTLDSKSTSISLFTFVYLGYFDSGIRSSWGVPLVGFSIDSYTSFSIDIGDLTLWMSLLCTGFATTC